MTEGIDRKANIVVEIKTVVALLAVVLKVVSEAGGLLSYLYAGIVVEDVSVVAGQTPSSQNLCCLT